MGYLVIFLGGVAVGSAVTLAWQGWQRRVAPPPAVGEPLSYQTFLVAAAQAHGWSAGYATQHWQAWQRALASAPDGAAVVAASERRDG